jgi:ribonuclease P protein component
VTATFNFPPELRLTDKPAFDRVFAAATSSRDRFFTVLATSNELAHPRLGLVVSRKVSRKAVRRNRIRRVVRESFRAIQHDLSACDLVVLARPAACDADNGELRDSLATHWRRSAA